MPQKIAILGGTFDPVHIGHLCLANWVYHNLALDQLIFLPAAVPPHKQYSQITPFTERVKMIELAILDRPGFQVSDLENKRSGPSYTVETLRVLKQMYPADQLWWVMGLDSLYQLSTWHRYQEIVQFARLAVVPRPGEQSDHWAQVKAFVDNNLPVFKDVIDWVEMPRLAISSSEIRAWCQAGQDCRYLVPDRVWENIQVTLRYGSGEATPFNT